MFGQSEEAVDFEIYQTEEVVVNLVSDDDDDEATGDDMQLPYVDASEVAYRFTDWQEMNAGDIEEKFQKIQEIEEDLKRFPESVVRRLSYSFILKK